MEQILSILIGIGLSATCGFRIFVPLLGMSIAHHAGALEFASGFAWIGSWPATIAFGIAMALEIAAYYIPWLDNLLDTVATPAAVVAGMVATASVVTGMDPIMRLLLAIIAGGGLAGAVQMTTASGRQLSSLTTGGFANPVLSTIELAGSLGLSLLSVLAPIIAGLSVILLLIVVVRRMRKRRSTA